MNNLKIPENLLILGRETEFESRLRKFPGLIFAISIITASLLYSMWWATFFLFSNGFFYVLPFSGLLVHAWMIVLVHEGAHRNLTRSFLDRWILNLASGLVFLPFYGEPFRKFHLYHHGHTNAPDDPLWPAWKRNFFANHRKIYILIEIIPLLPNIIALFSARPGIENSPDSFQTERDVPFDWKSIWFFFFSLFVSVLLFYFSKPDILFLFGSFFFANLWGNLRHWCEHTGTLAGVDSNTFSFPLGMGIGNHKIHHVDPKISWIALALALRHRPKTISVWSCLCGICLDINYRHYDP